MPGDPDVVAAQSEAARLAQLGRRGEAINILRELIDRDPQQAKPRILLGNVWKTEGKAPQALEQYRKALELDPDSLLARVNMLRPLMDVHDWGGVGETLQWMQAQGADHSASRLSFIHPMDAMLMGLPAGVCKRSAEAHILRTIKTEAVSEARDMNPTHGGRLRVAYLSRDFRDHAVGHLIRSLIRGHDRQRFEVFAYSYGRDDGSRFRTELQAFADHFHDVQGLSDQEIAEHIRSCGVSILVDLGGHTTDNRMGILARRPAPIQWHYLGFPGTTGAPFVDGFVTDQVVSPPGQDVHFSERLVRLEGCFMVSDPDLEGFNPSDGQRSEWGLPQDAVVLCGFHQTAKIHPAVFEAWMAILSRVPKALLWLKEPWPEAQRRFAARASALGVDPARIRYASNVPDRRRHLLRVSCADLYLDAFGRYGGHSTALEALWLGVPLLTCAGDTFSSRVSMSLLRAAHLDSLVARDPEDYVDQVIRLSQDGAERSRLRKHLAHARAARQGLFDINAPVRALEQAMTEAWSCDVTRPRPNQSPMTTS